MGGFGSGRRPRGKKQLVEAALKLDIHAIRRSMLNARSPLCSIVWIRDAALVSGIIVLLPEQLIVQVGAQVLAAQVVYKNSRFGGISASCICTSCARRCNTLYVASNRLECRRCAGLVYESQYKNAADRALYKANKIMARLGASPDQAMFMRPARMWRKTYLRRLQRFADAQRLALSLPIPPAPGTG